MRVIQTFILRLLADADEPQALRGAVRSIADDEERAFADEHSLLALLHQMCHAADKYDVEQPQTAQPDGQHNSEGGDEQPNDQCRMTNDK